jgi:helix-turn-helix protein
VAKALAKGARITGPQRETLATQYAKRYDAGESIRKIAEDAGRSFGFVHGVLKESGVTLRGRGGATRGTKAATAGAKKTSAKKAATKKTTAKATTKAPVKKSG